MLYTGSVNRGVNLNVNIGAYDRSGEGLIFMSAFGYTSVVKAAARDLKKKTTVSIHWNGFVVQPKTMEIFSTKLPDSDYSHLVTYKKDCTYVHNNKEHIKFFAFIQNKECENWSNLYDMASSDTYPEELINIFYDKLYKMSPAPIIKDWIPYLVKNFINSGEIREATTIFSTNETPLKCIIFDASVEDIVFRIQRGLRANLINIGGTNEVSPFMSEVQGIDAYLNEYSEVLTKKIQDSFAPMFVPNVDEYNIDLESVTDYMYDNDNIKLYPAQKDVAQAITNTFNAGNKCAFVIGECGSGKTAMAIAAVTVHFGEIKRNVANSYMTNIVMCPGHLLSTWEREINNRAPRSQAIIVKDFNHLLQLMPMLKGEERRHKHIWLIISKETAKFGYELRPGAVWREYKRIPGTLTGEQGVFCCPECGKPLYYSTYEGRGRFKREIRHYLREIDFRQPSIKNNNIKCTNEIRKWNRKTQSWEYIECGCRLWVPSTKETLWDKVEGHENRWMKLGKAGWIQKQHVQRLYDRLVSKDKLTSDEAILLAGLTDEVTGDRTLQKAPRKYPIARFIRQYLKGYIDYFLADECHLLKGKDSLQGEAFGDMIYTAKHVLALTGTLLNGYASGIYYILFRMFAKKMLKEGYEFGNSAEFSKDYGVTRQSMWYEMGRNGQLGDSVGSSSIKELPGVSPIVFTKFLLENAAFISLEDIAEALPGYEEIPVPLNMPSDLRAAYDTVENAVRRLQNGRNSKVMSQIIQLLSAYPDQPYGQPSIIDPETGDVLLVPPEVSSEYRDKENALLDIVSRKVGEGEHVLVYYTWTNRTDVATRVPRFLEEYGYNVAVLDNNVKPADREAWIQRKINDGVQVLFCNPMLIETGLTLLDFTTIVYYQMGYNLYTMRQASRRSWRINQNHDVQVYFLYYRGTVQEQALSLMATKLQAAMAIEGKFSEEGLNAMSNNEDILTQIASSVTEGIKNTVDVQVFQKNAIQSHKEIVELKESKTIDEPIIIPYSLTAPIKQKKNKKSIEDYRFNGVDSYTLEIMNKLMGF